MAGAFTLPKEYWSKIQITPQEIEHLQTYLFERETPLTTRDLALAFVDFRIKSERAASDTKRDAGSKTFFPAAGVRFPKSDSAAMRVHG